MPKSRLTPSQPPRLQSRHRADAALTAAYLRELRAHGAASLVPVALQRPPRLATAQRSPAR